MALGKSTVSGYAFYACVQSPVTKYQCDGSKSLLDMEYKINLLVDASDWKEFTKRYKQQKSDPITSEEFVKKFKVEPPEDVTTNGDGEYCILTFKTNAGLKDRKTGKAVPAPKPRVLIKNPATGKLIEIESLVGNGSKVMVQWQEHENKKWSSLSAKLKAIRVDELVEYSTGDDLSELGDIEENGLLSRKPHDEGFDELEEDDTDTVPFEVDDNDDEY
jgi:hypothetical protein